MPLSLFYYAKKVENKGFEVYTGFVWQNIANFTVLIIFVILSYFSGVPRKKEEFR